MISLQALKSYEGIALSLTMMCREGITLYLSWISGSKLCYLTLYCRAGALSAVCLLQAWMSRNFMTFHMRRSKDVALELKEQKKSTKGMTRLICPKHQSKTILNFKHQGSDHNV